MMRYSEELVAARSDWDALAAQANAGGVGRALIGRSTAGHARRFLLAKVLPTGSALADNIHCRNQQLTLLEMHAECAGSDVDARLAELARMRVGATPLLATTAPRPQIWRWDALQRRALPITALRLLSAGGNDTWPALEHCDLGDRHAAAPFHQRLQRQLAALGAAGQRQLSALTIAVAGCGGTGGMVAQLLALTGVGRLLLIDDDQIEQSNRNRLVAATDADVLRGTYKVAAMQRYLRRLAPDVAVAALPRSLYDRRSTRTIVTADLLVGCTDNEGSRLHMNALAVQYLLPYVDCGAGIERRAEAIVAGGQVRVVLPGGACLECYGGIDRWLAAHDLATPGERARRQTAGYGLDNRPAPMLALLNAAIAAEAVASIVAIATGLRPIQPFLAYDLIAARLAPRQDARPSPVCPTCATGQRYGRGDALPLPCPAADVRGPLPMADVPVAFVRKTRFSGRRDQLDNLESRL